jgi:hypothetical protein
LRAAGLRVVLRAVDFLRPVVFFAANPSTSIHTPDEVHSNSPIPPSTARLSIVQITSVTTTALNSRCTNAHSTCN